MEATDEFYFIHNFYLFLLWFIMNNKVIEEVDENLEGDL